MAEHPPQLPGYQLPAQPQSSSGRAAEGFLTPSQDLLSQVLSIPPRRVLPIIFLPGIMGSNLRMSRARQDEMNKTNNIAWRPENTTASLTLSRASTAVRQNQLDPLTTEVDEYDPATNPTGNASETADKRHDNAKVGFILSVGIDTPLLMDDPATTKPRKSKEQKARERGWGEIFFDSYRELLEMCEQHLNTAFRYERMDSWWTNIVGVSPAEWQASATPALQPLNEETLKKAVKGCWFPVHAMGYNWLQSNRDSGVRVAKRITALMERYKEQGYHCEKVIVVTHSMGGLVGRALIHPAMGKLEDKVLGIVHGVMPAIGAGAAYKRMRCGFEDPGLDSMSPLLSVTAKVLGNFGPEVMAVLGNAQGGLELLPSKAYGNNWLQLTQARQIIKSLPEKGDPYEEIYKIRNKWYGLLREDWINPASNRLSGFENSALLLDKAKKFHEAIVSTYHPQSYAHYGADRKHPAWRYVVWEINQTLTRFDIDQLQIVTDNRQGELHVIDPKWSATTTPVGGLGVNMQPADDPGDQTVPVHSAEHQLLSGKFKGIFRQSGYEHQNSYKDERALHSTLYSLVKIVQTMVWSSA